MVIRENNLENSLRNKLGKIVTENYTTKIDILEPKLLRFFRHHHWPDQKEHIDAFSRYWSLALIDGRSSQVATLRDGKKILLSGCRAIFSPSFSIVNWCILSETIDWVGYISDLPLEGINFSEPVAFSWDGHHLPESAVEIEQLLKSATEITAVGVRASDILVRKLKNRIDQSYKQSVSIQEMAEQLGSPRESLIRRFKVAYGLTPVQYRLKLRLYEATVDLMTKPLTVGQIAHKAGFNDVSFFNKAFKRELNTTPSNFQFLSRL